MRSDPTPPSRRTFLRLTGAAALALPAAMRARADTARSRQEEIHMEIKRSGSQPSNKGPAEYFTGKVRIDPLFEAPEPARVRGASVSFERYVNEHR